MEVKMNKDIREYKSKNSLNLTLVQTFVGVIGKDLIVFFPIRIQTVISHGEKYIVIEFDHVPFVIADRDLCKIVCI